MINGERKFYKITGHHDKYYWVTSREIMIVSDNDFDDAY